VDKRNRPQLKEAGVCRRIAAVESLCRYAQAGIQLKMGDSAKLSRADEDLGAAISALMEIRIALGEDEKATSIALAGKLNAAQYLKGATRSA
jgi:hypothetical protein